MSEDGLPLDSRSTIDGAAMSASPPTRQRRIHEVSSASNPLTRAAHKTYMGLWAARLLRLQLSSQQLLLLFALRLKLGLVRQRLQMRLRQSTTCIEASRQTSCNRPSPSKASSSRRQDCETPDAMPKMRGLAETRTFVHHTLKPGMAHFPVCAFRAESARGPSPITNPRLETTTQMFGDC